MNRQFLDYLSYHIGLVSLGDCDSQPMRIRDCADAVDAANAEPNNSSRRTRAVVNFSMDFSSGKEPRRAVFEKCSLPGSVFVNNSF